jgi:3-oxoacyl-[acyl-carrier protein] reductase
MFAREGAKVVITDMHLERCRIVADEIERDFGIDTLAVQCDVTDRQDIEKAINETMERFGRVDILLNNAGTNRPSQIVDITDEVWDLVINTCLRGTFFCCRAILPIMMKQDFGRIVNTTSVAAFKGLKAGHAHYAAAKAGVMAFTRCLAMEGAPYHITANTIAPSFIYNDFIPHIYPQEEIERMYAEIPYPRKGTPDDVANTILFLVSNEGEYITGQTICVTGGSWMR